MPETTANLTGRIAAGDTGALAELYEAWFDRLYAEARRSTRRDESFCLDVVHDVMLRIVKSMKPLPNEAALAAWLRLTVRSCAYDRLRSDARRRRREEAAGAARREAGGRDAEFTERLEWLEGQIRGLDADAAALLVLRHRFGWTLARIGAALGLTAGAIDGRLRRVVEALGQRAREDFDE